MRCPQYPRRHLTAVGSTNAEALQWAKEGARDFSWVTAEEQTQGRGRSGRSWHSPKGNLYASVVVRSLPSQIDRATFGFVCGLAIHEAICSVAPEIADRVLLKWPNDVLLDGAKISGILIEHHSVGPSLEPAMVAGFGLNICSHPGDTPYPCNDLLSVGVSTGPDTVWEALNKGLWRYHDQWLNAGFAPIREHWLARAHGLGQRITITNGYAKALTGVFQTIDPQGCLVLESDDHRLQRVTAGDVFFSSGSQAVA